MNKADIKNILAGYGQISIFMPEGIARFAKDRQSALKSFIIPAILYPVTYLAFRAIHGIESPLALPIHAVIAVGFLLLYYAIMWFMMSAMKSAERFWHFVNVSNHFSLVSFVFLTPVWIAVFIRHVQPGEMDQFWVFYMFIMLVYNAFIAMHTINLSWMLGGFVATIALFCSDIKYRAIVGTLEIAGIPMK